MPNVNDLKQSRFLKPNDVEPPVLVTIKSYELVNVAMENTTPDEKYCLSFHELNKPLVLNSTNGQVIAAITGSEEFDDWINRKVVLYNDPTVSFGSKITGGIRCRAPRQVKKAETQENPDWVGDNPEPPPDDGIPY